ncbi:MAG: cell division protein FtsL [Lysobacterales bacterium]
MNFRISFVVFLCVTAAGCSATTTASTSGQLQIKMAHLERKVQERDAEVIALKQEVSDLSRAVNGLEIEKQDLDYDANDNFKTYRKYQKPTASKTAVKRTSKATTSSKTKIISKATQTISKNDIVRVMVDHKKIQVALKNAGYYEGGIDGKIGSGSKRAIGEFQKDHDLQADGIIGSKTWSELQTYLD